MSKVADTSFLVAFFDADDARHAETRRRMANTRPVIVCAEVLVETLGVLKVKADRATSLAALEALMRMPNIQWDERADILGSHETMRREVGLSYVDAAVITCCVRHRSEPLTYDQAQERAARRRLKP